MVTKEERALLEDLRQAGITPKEDTPFKQVVRASKSQAKQVARTGGKLGQQTSRGLGRELRNIRRQVRGPSKKRTNSRNIRIEVVGAGQQVPIQQPMQQFQQPQQQQQIQREPQRRGGMTNFFAHRSDKEVFGDDGLTLFDSNKARSKGFSTGGMFGF